jgi:hypothetical protein
VGALGFGCRGNKNDGFEPAGIGNLADLRLEEEHGKTDN